MRSQWKNIFNRRIAATLLLAFSSGLPFSLAGTTLQAWLAQNGASIETIGLMGLVGLPYVYKFLWSPLLDRFVPPFLGRRRGWIIILQLSLALAILLMGYCNPLQDGMVLLAITVAFLSASQDIVIDAYRIDLLAEHERGLGLAVTVAGYRTAIVLSGAIAMGMAFYLGWRITYTVMALLMLLCVIATWFAPEPSNKIIPPPNLKQAIVIPFLDFFKREQAGLLLLLVICYKLGDFFAQSLSTVFLLKGMGFNLIEVAAMNKGLGVLATIFGAFVGGFLLLRINLFLGLIYFGIVQALSHFMFMWLAMAGRVYFLLAASVFAENFASGLGTSAYFALLMSLCDPRYSATQYALLSALFAFVRVVVSPVAGFTVAYVGWVEFFAIAFIISIPGIALVLMLRPKLVFQTAAKN